MDAKTASRLKTAIKLIIVILAYAYAGYRIATAPDIKEFSSYFSNLGLQQGIILSVILILMPINWILETLKWKLLVHSIEPSIGLGKCIKAVTTGVTVGTITPNRAGEFVGRIIYVSPENRAKASYLTIFGDSAQFCATIIFGIAGLLAIGQYVNESVPQTALITISSICAIIAIAVFLKFDSIVNAIANTQFVKKHLLKYVPQCEIKKSTKLSTIALSIARYIIFSTQYYLSLKFFGIDIAIPEAFAAIAATYACTYIIPNIAAAELGIRVSFAIMFIGLFSTQETAIALASLLLYIINVGIPIAIGGIFMIKEKK